MLAEALYAQGRLDEARQMTEEAQAAAALDSRTGHPSAKPALVWQQPFGV